MSGFVVFFGDTLIAWKSKKQVTVSLSSAEAEYRSMRRLVAELSWLSRLLHEGTITSVTPIPVKCDNLAAIYIAKNPVFHERTKHIEIDCHFVREWLLSNDLITAYIPSRLQLANIFTKALGKQQFHFLQSKLGMINPHALT